MYFFFLSLRIGNLILIQGDHNEMETYFLGLRKKNKKDKQDILGVIMVKNNELQHLLL